MGTLSDAFYEYARLSKIGRQRLGYLGTVSTDPDNPDGQLIPGDATTAIIPPEIDYPNKTDIYGIPGTIGGPPLDGDNSLTYPGAVLDIAPPLALELTVPDHTIGILTLSTGDLTSIQPADQGETATVTVYVISRYVTTTEVAKLIDGAVTMQAWTGAGYVAQDVTYGWEGGAQMVYNVDLASADTDQLKFKIEFNTLHSVKAADYEFFVTVEIGGVVKAEEMVTAAVS